MSTTLTLFDPLRSFLRCLQVILIFSIVALYTADLSGIYHEDPDGGATASATRHWYHMEIQKIPNAKKVYLGEPSSESDSEEDVDKLDSESSESQTKTSPNLEVSSDVAKEVTVLENGVATAEATKGMTEFYGDDICIYAEEAVGIRRKARYGARARGSLLVSVMLYLRDIVIYGGQNDFAFETMVQLRQEKSCKSQKEKAKEEQGEKFDSSSFSCVELARKELCTHVYEGAKRSNESYNKRLLNGENPHHHLYDQFFGYFKNYEGFVVETTVFYMIMVVLLGTTFTVIDRILSRQIMKAKVSEAVAKDKKKSKSNSKNASGVKDPDPNESETAKDNKPKESESEVPEKPETKKDK